CRRGDRRGVSGRLTSADHLSGGGACRCAERRGVRLSRLPEVGRGGAILHERRLHGSEIGPVRRAPAAGLWASSHSRSSASAADSFSSIRRYLARRARPNSVTTAPPPLLPPRCEATTVSLNMAFMASTSSH